MFKYDDVQLFVFKGNLVEFDLLCLVKVVKGCINVEFDVCGMFGELIDVVIKFVVCDSDYVGLLMIGDGNVYVCGECLLFSDVKFDVVGNKVSLWGSFGGVGDCMYVDVDVLQFVCLQFGVSGVLILFGDVFGMIKCLQVDVIFCVS